KCPKCGEVIKVSQAISHDIEIELKKKYDKEILDIKETTARDLKDKESEIGDRLEKERVVLEEKLKKELKESQHIEVTDLQNQIKEKTKRLEEAEQNELILRKKQRALEEKEKKLELEMNRRLDNERKQITEKIHQEIEESHKLKDAEKAKQLEDMKGQIENLKRKAEQASQKTQGEVLELELEQVLKDEFPFDDIDPVSSGVKGGDVIQTVKTQSGRICGKILWETKRTKVWSDNWTEKLKGDQHKVKADLAVIVSEVLPKGLHHFRQIKGIWVTDIPSALSLSLALRSTLIQVATTKQIQTGKEEKKEIIYNYLTGTEFRNRVQAITEAFINMKRDLDTERRAMEKNWAKREKQIDKVVLNIAGMHGDLEGIAGTSLPAIKMLELPAGETRIKVLKKVKKA
ncbi:MAG: DUF2130 domain-containing protein, partial [Candidatus Omnitrophica bacterium]|nr:DUF2130 domain-containing protein [Candidatus Omnitrophota bacterium]